MSKLSFALGILVLPFAFYSVQAQAAETKAGTATVAGSVTLKGEPARGVTVILQTQNQDQPNAPRARTDENGRYHFTGIAAGKYVVSALAPGYFSLGLESYRGLRGKTLNLTEGEKIENADLEIKRGGVITGRVVDSQRRPVIEERVYLNKLGVNNLLLGPLYYSQILDMYETDDRGLYRIYGLPEGRYLVSVGYVERTGSAAIPSRREFYPHVFYPNAANESEAKVVEVSEGSEAANIDITVPDPKHRQDIYGRVVDAGGGQPVAGVAVMVGGVTKDGRYDGISAGGGARSGPNGEFRIFGALPGKYAILARPGQTSGSEFISDPVIVDVGEDTVTGVEVRVQRSASISGFVVIEGTNDPKVRAKLSQVSLMAFVRSASQVPSPSNEVFGSVNADGSFRFSGLQPGKVSIFVDSFSNVRDLLVSRIERNGAPVSGGIEVEAGEQVTGVRIILVHGALAIRGELRFIGGTLPAGCLLRAVARRVDQPSQSQPYVDIDARGQFVIENLPPGEYEIIITPFFHSDGPPGQRPGPEIARRISSIRERVVLSGGNQQPVTIEIDLSRKEGDR